MSHIYILSPSSSVLDKAAYKRGITRLMAQGHTLDIDQDVLSRSTRFAGDDVQRLSAIKRAAASGADVVMSSTAYGGSSQVTDVLAARAPSKLRKHTFDVSGSAQIVMVTSIGGSACDPAEQYSVGSQLVLN